jgi:hypothetical protein
VVVAEGVDESRYQYRPLFNDETVIPGQRYMYRVRARNESGFSAYSNVVGPVEPGHVTIVDEMESYERVYQKDGELRLLTHQDIRKAREDRSRLTGGDGCTIVYKIPGEPRSVRIEALRTTDGSSVRCQGGVSADKFQPIATDSTTFKFGQNDYGFFDGVVYTMGNVPPDVRFLRLTLSGGVQIGRVEITHSPPTRPEER